MEKLKKLRIKKKISIKQMAEYLNISYAYYWQIENNKRQLYYSLAIKIAKIFDEAMLKSNYDKPAYKDIGRNYIKFAKELIQKFSNILVVNDGSELEYNSTFEKIKKLKEEGAKLVLVFGIGRTCHIAFWEPQFADEFQTEEEWKKQPYRIAAKLHPLTIEQNAITSFKSRTTLVPCRANTIGPGLFLQADYVIGGADGALGRGMGWQGMSFLMALHYGPDKSVTASYIPTLPGKLFYLKELKGPLTPECN